MENKNLHKSDWLSKIYKDQGFKIPEGYFDALKEELSTKLAEESLSKGSGFEIPEGYFQGLEERILSKVEHPKKGKIVSLRTIILRVSAVAAIVTLLLTIYFSPKENAINPTYDEIAAWIEENIGEIDTDYIISAMGEELNLKESFIESNNIENYLDENDTYILIEESLGLFDEVF